MYLCLFIDFFLILELVFDTDMMLNFYAMKKQSAVSFPNKI